MRDYALFQAEFRAKAYAFPRLRRRLRHWWARRTIDVLEGLDDRRLTDIGLCREDLVLARLLPLDSNPLDYLQDARGREVRLRGHRSLQGPVAAAPDRPILRAASANLVREMK